MSVQPPIVHYVLDRGPSQGAHRPAIAVKYLNGGQLNLQVFLDHNDGIFDYHGEPKSMLWLNEVGYSEGDEPGTWHHIESQ